MTRPALAALFSLLLFGLPVGGDQGPGLGDDDDVQGDDDDDTPYVKPGPWQDMTFLQRLEYIEEVVQPISSGSISFRIVKSLVLMFLMEKF